MKIRLPNDFTPRPYQKRFMAYFDKGGKNAVWVVHRRGGKDLTAMHQLCKMAHQRRGVYWHVFPTFEQGRKAIWEGFRSDGPRILNNVFPPELVARKNEQQMMLELKCGSIYRVMGSDKIEVVGAGPVGVIFSEYSVSKPRAADLIDPMLAENGGWQAYCYTPRGNNHGKKLFDRVKNDPSWFCEIQTLQETEAYDFDATIARARAAGRPEAIIRQEYLCDWAAANVGSVYGDLVERLENAGKLAAFDHPTDGVFTSWDLGISDSTAIWWWRVVDGGVDVIDYEQCSGKPLSHFFDVIESKPYQYIKHWLPHDARARSLATGSSVLDQFFDRFGRDSVAIGPAMSLADGIAAARWLLQRSVRIHERCGDGIEALKQYHYAWDEDRKTFSSKPEHDLSSHGADAFRYLALVAKVTSNLVKKEAKPTAPLARSMNSFALEELWDTAPRASGRI